MNQNQKANETQQETQQKAQQKAQQEAQQPPEVAQQNTNQDLQPANQVSKPKYHTQEGKGSLQPIPGRCGAKLRRKTTFCMRWPLKGRKRCSVHGGASTGSKTQEGKKRQLLSHLKSKAYISPESLKLFGGETYKYAFCISQEEADFVDALFDLIDETYTVVDHTQLFFAAQLAVQIERKLSYAAQTHTTANFARDLSAYNTTLRELNLTRKSIAETKDTNAKADLMTLLADRFNLRIEQ